MAGGAVTVTVNGVGELVGVTSRSGEFDGTDSDDLADLTDMIIAAYRDARAKAEAMANEAMGPLAGGLERTRWRLRRPRRRACPGPGF